MHLDVRLPVGLMFSFFGALLVAYGAVSDRAIYDAHSLGININLDWGGVLFLFGAAMLWLVRRSRRQAEPPPRAGRADAATGRSQEP
jgi:hypothetical protein